MTASQDSAVFFFQIDSIIGPPTEAFIYEEYSPILSPEEQALID